MFKPKEKKIIKLSDISPNTYNAQEMSLSVMKSLVANIKKHGFTDPIKVRNVLDIEKEQIKTPYVIVDGEHRFRAFSEVFPDSDEIDCIITNIDKLSDAMQATLSANALKGEPNPVKRAEILEYMINNGTSFEDIDELIGISKDRVESMINSLDIPDIKDSEVEDFSGSTRLKTKL